jgi:hypothetical protein
MTGRAGVAAPRTEGRVHAAQDGDAARRGPAVDLQGLLGLVDRRRDGGGHDHIGRVVADELLQPGVVDVMGHRVEEAHLGVAIALERPTDIGHPARRLARTRRSRIDSPPLRV